MFDSIGLKIHGVSKYKQVDMILYDHEKGVRKYITLDDVPKLHESKLQQEVRQWTQYNDTKKIVEHSYTKKHYLPSSHYELNYYRDDGKDTYNFDFSVPKYLHATNLFQSIYHEVNASGSPRSDTFDRYSWLSNGITKGNIDVAFRYLTDFIQNKFLKHLFPYVEFDMKDIQISRLDISFNQVFKSKADAMEYLGYQRELRKNYSRDSENYVRDWRTAISYVGSRYSFKIYHKGSEFSKKGDKKKLININEQLIKQGKKNRLYDIPLLTKFADKILRYELTCHSKYISYIHFQKVFRANDAKHQQDKIRYNKLLTIVNDPREYNHKVGIMRLSQGDKEFYRNYQSLINKRLDFRLDADFQSRCYHTESGSDYLIYQTKFTQDHLFQMCLKLKQFFDEFTVSQIPAKDNLINTLQDFNAKIKELNDLDKRYYELQGVEPKRGMYESVFKSFVHHLFSFGSFEKLRQSAIYNERTLRRIVNRCKELGFNVKILGDVDKMNVCNDFENYHNFIDLNFNKLHSHFNNF